MTDRDTGRRADTVERLRTDINRGLTKDKVPGTDPAAAPLGADEEAAGTPVPPHAVAQTRAQELSRPMDAQVASGRRDVSHWIFIAVIVIAAAALAFWALR